jgi:hypothetical protein
MPRGLEAEALLACWERGLGQDPVGRAVGLWRLAEPDRPPEELTAEPIGRRDASLLRLRIAIFGPLAECFMSCPACDEPLEFPLDLRALLVDQPDQGPGPWTVQAGGFTVRFRLPDSRDLRAVHDAPDPKQGLLRRCVVSASHESALVASDQLPEAVAGAVEVEMGRLDPQADLSLDLGCGACQHRWPATFDITAFFWREIEVAAGQLLREVDALARVYGWSEGEILRLGPGRRRRYLELVGVR